MWRRGVIRIGNEVHVRAELIRSVNLRPGRCPIDHEKHRNFRVKTVIHGKSECGGCVVLLLLNGGGGEGMTLLGRAEHERLVQLPKANHL